MTSTRTDNVGGGGGKLRKKTNKKTRTRTINKKKQKKWYPCGGWVEPQSPRRVFCSRMRSSTPAKGESEVTLSSQSRKLYDGCLFRFPCTAIPSAN